MLHRINHDLTTLTLYHNDTSDCMQCVHTDVFIKTYCVMALYINVNEAMLSDAYDSIKAISAGIYEEHTDFTAISGQSYIIF